MDRAPDEVARLADAARALYVFHRRLAEERRTGVPSRYRPGPRWDGGVDRAGRRYPPAWPKLAAAALSEGADLAAYVAAQFAGGGTIPEPNQAYGPAARDRWRAAAAGDAARDARRRLAIHHDQFAREVARVVDLTGLAAGAAARIVLDDPAAPLSALYRHCVAARAGEAGIAAAWKERALAQYLQAAAGYRDGWAGFVPAPLIEEADLIRERLCSEGAAPCR